MENSSPRKKLAAKIAALRPKRRGPVAFVFSGGGPLGALQVGQLGALLAAGVNPDFVVGSSIGALNAAYIAANPTVEGASNLRDLWLRMRSEDFFPNGRFSSAWNAVRKGDHVFSNDGLRQIVTSEFPAMSFEDLEIPAHVVATRLQDGSEEWFDKGDLVDPLLASTAMPGIFAPVKVDGVSYIDGGVSNNVPFAKAIELGAGRVYILNVHSAEQDRPLNRPHDFVMHGFLLARAQRYRREIELNRKKVDIIEMPAVELGYVPFTSLSETERLIEAGYESTLEFLGHDAPPLLPEPAREFTG